MFKKPASFVAEPRHGTHRSDSATRAVFSPRLVIKLFKHTKKLVITSGKGEYNGRDSVGVLGGENFLHTFSTIDASSRARLLPNLEVANITIKEATKSTYTQYPQA